MLRQLSVAPRTFQPHRLPVASHWYLAPVPRILPRPSTEKSPLVHQCRLSEKFKVYYKQREECPMKRKTAIEISCTSWNVNFPLLNGAKRKETVRLRLSSLSLPCQIVTISLIITFRMWLWRSQPRKKCCASSIPCPHSHFHDESIPCRCWWTLSIESSRSNLA